METLPSTYTSALRDHKYQLELDQHLIVIGAHGTGKSNAVHFLMDEMKDAVAAGEVIAYAANHKANELSGFVGTSYFAGLSLGMDEAGIAQHIQLFAQIQEDLDLRLEQEQDPAVNVGELPTRVVFIEEITDLRELLNRAGAEGQEAVKTIDSILVQGRFLDFYIVATATPDMAGTSQLVANFGHRVLFHQPSRYVNNVVLGVDADWDGHDSTKLPAPTEENKYAVAGYGYASDGHEVQPIKFSYISDSDLAELIERFKEEGNG